MEWWINGMVEWIVFFFVSLLYDVVTQFSVVIGGRTMGHLVPQFL